MIYCQYPADNVRIAGDQPEFIVGKRLLRMQIGVLDKAENPLCGRITAEFNTQPVKYMHEPLDSPVLSGSYYSAGFYQLRLPSADVSGFIELVNPAVFERAVSMYAGFVCEGICPDAGRCAGS